jgi:hypothetical protein
LNREGKFLIVALRRENFALKFSKSGGKIAPNSFTDDALFIAAEGMY